ncbi:MAG: exodeoxyribonuclease VII large subunit [Phocaeicola sp.]|uniref:exodeoxyribonuclease VII large subunit n=1 Tax=Phocaeicola TaxID=909656 RepID=UPI00234F545A|nr:exodeoxyribonuclease VII large subunit [Phocaeicola oris]MCE2615905.1 exodeoxyribonuclease VII large subunit [Phocaeicola oris]
MEQVLSLFELNNLVKQTLELSLPNAYWVQAELSEARVNYTGHCYVEFVQKDEKSSALVAKARGNIWKNTYNMLKPYFEEETGQKFCAGIKVLVQVQVEFHELYGYSLTVLNIDPTYTLGDMARRRREILKKLEEEGVLNLNKELELPLFAQRIAVISSATAAGYEDFCNQLKNNSYGYVFYPELFPAVMQGNKVESSIIAALNAVYHEMEKWDAVVIIRGGGATSDLSGFDTYDLAANVAQFPLPIITGIGHERDDTVLDSVSHTRVKTPTAAAEFLINHLHDTAEELESKVQSLTELVAERMSNEKERLNRLVERIPYQISKRLEHELFRQKELIQQMQGVVRLRFMKEKNMLDLLKQRLILSVYSCMEKEDHRLKLIEQQIRAASPEYMLKRGYSITLLNGKVVKDASEVKDGDILETLVMNGKIKSKVYGEETNL